MKNVFILAKKEIKTYFNSWLGVLVFVFFFIIAGLFFSVLVLNYSQLSMNPSDYGLQDSSGLNQIHFVFGSFFINISIILLFLVPLLSMRSFSEEKRQETLELLFTYPLSDFELVLGKFLGLVWIFELLLLPLFGYILVFYFLGGEIEWGPIVLGFIGFWFLGNAYLSLGLFVSTLTKSPVISAVVTFGFLIVFWIFNWVAGITDGALGQFFTALSPLDHYKDFTLGVLNLNHVIYFCFFHFYFLFLALRSIETRNWKN